jgi:hypothetical protein
LPWVIAGLLAPFWWTWLISKLIYGLFLLSGSPNAPSAPAFWTLILSPSLALGLLAGVGIGFLSARPIFGWLLFVVGVAVGSILFNSLSVLSELVASPGSWAFALGALAGSLAWARANNSFKPKPLRGSA